MAKDTGPATPATRVLPVDSGTVDPVGRLWRRMVARQHAFRTASVIFMLNRGIRQFLDLGSGLPVSNGPHEVDIACLLPQSATVVHVDSDPDVIERGRRLADDIQPLRRFLCADLTEVDLVLMTCAHRKMLDLREPVGLVAVNVLHYVPSLRHLQEAMARYHAQLAQASASAVTHLAPEWNCEEKSIVHPREQSAVAALLSGMQLVNPGVVSLPDQWMWGKAGMRETTEPVRVLGGLGVKQ